MSSALPPKLEVKHTPAASGQLEAEKARLLSDLRDPDKKKSVPASFALTIVAEFIRLLESPNNSSIFRRPSKAESEKAAKDGADLTSYYFAETFGYRFTVLVSGEQALTLSFTRTNTGTASDALVGAHMIEQALKRPPDPPLLPTGETRAP